jgi:hypothetical protein
MKWISPIPKDPKELGGGDLNVEYGSRSDGDRKLAAGVTPLWTVFHLRRFFRGYLIKSISAIWRNFLQKSRNRPRIARISRMGGVGRVRPCCDLHSARVDGNIRDVIMKDPIVQEIHRHRADYAKRFNYDVHAVREDIRRQSLMVIEGSGGAGAVVLRDWSEVRLTHGLTRCPRQTQMRPNAGVAQEASAPPQFQP